jgi:hypothetical protein
MTEPQYIPGLATKRAPQTVPDSELESIKEALWSADNGRFFSMFPASTPKYARNAGPRSSDRTDSMARMYVNGRGPRIHDANLQKSIGNLYTGGVLSDGATERSGGTNSPNGYGYFDFIISNWSISYQEREQAVDTLSDNTVIFYSGMSAPMGQGSGALLNTFQDDQNVWFHYAYMESLRGSRLAAKGQVASFLCDSFRYEGYLTSLSVQTQAQIQNAVMFNFTFRVKQISVVTPVLYSASANAEVWSSRQEPLVITTPSSIDDTTRVGSEAAVNPVSARSAPAAVASADANSRDPRATIEQADMTFTEAEAEVANQIASEHAAAESAAQATDITFTLEEADQVESSLNRVLNNEASTSTSGDIAPTSLPANTAPETILTPEQQRIADLAGAANVPFGGGTELARDPSSGRFLSVGTGTATAGGASSAGVPVSASVAADRIAASAQKSPVSGPIYGQTYANAPSTLPAYARGNEQLPNGFTDIYRVQGTVFAEAYARAASQVATVQTAGGALRTVVGRRSRRRSGPSSVRI